VTESTIRPPPELELGERLAVLKKGKDLTIQIN
jgi:hypothetical protein